MMRVNPFRRSRHARRWWQAPAAELNTEPFAAPAPEPEPVEHAEGLLVTDTGEFYRDAEALFAGVAATRARIENRGAEEAVRKRREAEHRRQHGPWLSPAAVIPPPPMPGGAA